MSDLVRPVGPVDILVVGFPENRFDGSIAPAIADLVARRDRPDPRRGHHQQGQRRARSRSLEIADLDGDGVNDLAVMTGDIPGLIGEDDERAVAEELPAGSTVAMIAWENTWAIGASMAIRQAGGVVMAHERIAPGDVDAVLSVFELEAAGA